MKQRMILSLCAAGFAMSSSLATAQELPVLRIDPRQISVSGLSSGAFMAVQLHVAFSSIFNGVGVFAGGIYGCAEGQLVQAQTKCMALPDQIDPNHYVQLAQFYAQRRSIDPLSNLARQHVYIYAGTQDFTVRPTAAAKLRDFYAAFDSSPNIQFKNDIPSAHGQPTVDSGGACNLAVSPWILRCNYDGAGAALTEIYGALQARARQAAPGSLIPFDQTPFASQDALMGDTGYVYIPRDCSTRRIACRLHVALHGCLQSPDTQGTAYETTAGYNEWAETNHIVVLYPTTRRSTNNPSACWDWWGYTGSDYEVKSGRQMQAIRKMIGRVSGI